MIYIVLESRGKVRENEFCRVVGTMGLYIVLLLLKNGHVLLCCLHVVGWIGSGVSTWCHGLHHRHCSGFYGFLLSLLLPFLIVGR